MSAMPPHDENGQQCPHYWPKILSIPPARRAGDRIMSGRAQAVCPDGAAWGCAWYSKYTTFPLTVTGPWAPWPRLRLTLSSIQR